MDKSTVNTVKGKKQAKRIGGKAAAGRDKYANLAQEIVQAHMNVEEATKPQLELVLQAAEKTNNLEAERLKLGEAMKKAYAAKGCPVKTAAVYTSEAIRICKAYWQTVTVQVDGEDKPVRKEGKELLQGIGYNVAKKRASSILAAANLKSKAGRPKNKPTKPMNRAELVDALDKLIGQVRVSATMDSAVLDALLMAKKHMLGDKVDGKMLGLSRGQKAKATRAANAKRAGRVVTIPASSTLQ